MKKRVWYSLGVMFVCTACSDFGVNYSAERVMPEVRSNDTVANEVLTSPPVSVSTGQAAVNRFVAVIVPAKAADLAPDFAGQLRSVHVEVGDRVEKVALIAQIDTRQLHDDLAVAEAVLHTARAAFRQAEVDVEDAERVFALEQRAVAKGVRPKNSIEEARFGVSRAQAALSHARASVEEEALRLEKARNRIADARINAPFAGRIAMLYTDPGATVGPESPVARLIADDRLRVRFAVKPERANAVVIGQRVAVDLVDVDQTFHAVTREIAPEIDSASKAIFVDAELELEDVDNSVIVPGAAAWVSISG